MARSELSIEENALHGVGEKDCLSHKHQVLDIEDSDQLQFLGQLIGSQASQSLITSGILSQLLCSLKALQKNENGVIEKLHILQRLSKIKIELAEVKACVHQTSLSRMVGSRVNEETVKFGPIRSPSCPNSAFNYLSQQMHRIKVTLPPHFMTLSQL